MHNAQKKDMNFVHFALKIKERRLEASFVLVINLAPLSAG